MYTQLYRCSKKQISFKYFAMYTGKHLCQSLSPVLILTTYWVRYQHAVPFLRNKTSYRLLKPSNPHDVQGVQHSTCPEFQKIRIKVPNCAFLPNIFVLFSLYRTHAHILQNSKISPGLFLIKFQVSSPLLYQKRDSSTGAFCEFCEIFKNTII